MMRVYQLISQVSGRALIAGAALTLLIGCQTGDSPGSPGSPGSSANSRGPVPDNGAAPPPPPLSVDTTAPGPPAPGGPAIEGTLTAAQMQDAVRNFADHYREVIATAADAVAQDNPDPTIRRKTHMFKLNGCTAVYDIAVDPVPANALLNMLVLISLQTNVLDAQAVRYFGERGEILVDRSKRLQEEVFRIAARIMSAEQRTMLLDMCNTWSQQNPGQFNFWYVRLDDLPGVSRDESLGNVLNKLTNVPLDVLNKFNPFSIQKGQEVAGEISALAERVSWLAPRLMILAQWRTEAVIYQTLETAEVEGAFDLASRALSVAETLPMVIDEQRQALFRDLNENDETLQKLLGSTTELTSDATELMTALDSVVGRVQSIQENSQEADRNKPKPTTPPEPGPPFDVTQYTQALEQLDEVVRHTTLLVQDLDAATSEAALDARLDEISGTVTWLILVAGGSLAGAGILIVLAAKLIPKRQARAA